MSEEESRGARTSHDMPLEDPRTIVATVAVRLPPFWPANPTVWFVQVQAQFSRRGITTSRRKYEDIVCALPMEYATEIQDLLLDPPEEEPYEKLKQQLIARQTSGILATWLYSNKYTVAGSTAQMRARYSYRSECGNYWFGATVVAQVL